MSIRSILSIPLIASAFLLAAPAFAQQSDDVQNADVSQSSTRPRIILTDEDDDASPAVRDDEGQAADNADNNDVALLPVDPEAMPQTDDSSNIAVASTVDDDSNSEKIIKGHGLQLGLTFLGVPDSIIDNWFAYHGSMWDGTANMGFSLDYILRFTAPCEMRFSLSWINAKTGDDFWLTNDHKEQLHLADFIRQDYSIVAIEVAAYHIIPIVQNASALTELDFYYGGGLWGGIILGGAEKYAIRSSCAYSAGDIKDCPHEPTSSDFTEMPWGIGFATIALGFKFTLVDILTIRAEGGFKGYFFGQLGMGVEF